MTKQEEFDSLMMDIKDYHKAILNSIEETQNGLAGLTETLGSYVETNRKIIELLTHE